MEAKEIDKLNDDINFFAGDLEEYRKLFKKYLKDEIPIYKKYT